MDSIRDSAVNGSLTPLGKMTVFYMPSHKLDDPMYSPERSARSAIHKFLIEHFRAYTHTPTPFKGYWSNREGALVHDVLERFEVSFDKEEDFQTLVEFIRTLAAELHEESVYLTRGDRSYLVNQTPD